MDSRKSNPSSLRQPFLGQLRTTSEARDQVLAENAVAPLQAEVGVVVVGGARHEKFLAEAHAGHAAAREQFLRRAGLLARGVGAELGAIDPIELTEEELTEESTMADADDIVEPLGATRSCQSFRGFRDPLTDFLLRQAPVL